MNQSENKTAEEILDSTAANYGKENFFNMAWDCEKPEDINSCALNAMETYANLRTASLIQTIENRVKDLEEEKLKFSFQGKMNQQLIINELRNLLTLIKS